MLKILKIFFKIIAKHTLRVCLTIILGNVFDLFNIGKIRNFKYKKYYKHFLKSLPNTLYFILYICLGFILYIFYIYFICLYLFEFEFHLARLDSVFTIFRINVLFENIF